MKSAIPENITHEELVALLREGTFPFDFNGINPAGFAQLGQGLTKENLLDDNTEVTIWGDAADRTVNQALYKLAMSIYAGDGLILNITVTADSGEPIPGVLVSGVYDSSANAIYTDSQGKASGFTVDTTASLTVSGFYDLEDTTVSVTGDRGETVEVSIVVPRRNFLSITSTQSRMFSPLCKRVDVTAVGGGAGGACGVSESLEDSSGMMFGGAGGGGGQVVVQESLVFEQMTKYTATVGAGGKAGTSWGSSGAPGKGGTSSFLGLSAVGGNAPTIRNTGAVNDGWYDKGWNPGADVGGGVGGKGTIYKGYVYETESYFVTATAGGNCTAKGYISFTEMGTFSGGGGGSGMNTKKSGGTPYGGSSGYWHQYSGGGRESTNGEKGSGAGGGGGGGARQYNGGGYAGGAGYRGVVNIRMWFEEDLAA